MKAFRFPLDRVLHWRATQCQIEEAAMARLIAERAQLAASLTEVASLRKSASDAISGEREIDSGLFQTLGHFHARIDHEQNRIRKLSQTLEREIAEQLRRTTEIRRKKKLLEIVRESRLKEWTALRDAEDEQAAADSWLSRFAAQRYTTTNASLPPR